jgi:glycosyltransferase involved in cell wall biosynthesis
VHFLGPVAPSDVPALHERADILMNSALIDNQPLSILEAMASGKVRWISLNARNV